MNKKTIKDQKREISGLQTLKFVCAIMVVQIHIYSFAQSFLLPLCRIAVPIFFMVTGFFSVDQCGQLYLPKLKKSFKKLLKLTIWAQLIWIIFTTVCAYNSFGLFIEKMYSLKFWLKFIYYGNNFGFMLWYLNILLETILVLIIFTKLNLNKYLWIFIPLGFILNLSLGSYSFIYHNGWFQGMVHRNFLTIGLPCVCLGIYIRKFEYFLPKTKILGYACLISLVVLTVESFLLSYTGKYTGKGGDIIISTIPLAFFVFLFFLKIHIPRCLNWTVDLGRKHSLNIYIFHKIIEIILFAAVGYSIYFIGGFIVSIVTVFLSMGLYAVKTSTWLPSRLTKILFP